MTQNNQDYICRAIIIRVPPCEHMYSGQIGIHKLPMDFHAKLKDIPYSCVGIEYADYVQEVKRLGIMHAERLMASGDLEYGAIVRITYKADRLEQPEWVASYYVSPLGL